MLFSTAADSHTIPPFAAFASHYCPIPNCNTRRMYPQYAHPALDPINGILPAGAMYHQPPPPPLQYSFQPAASFQSTAPTHPIQYPCVVAPPLEPLPSATDVPQTLGLPIHQLAEFASSMVYLMWHARRPSVMALHSESLSPTSSSEPGAEKEEQSTQDDHDDTHNHQQDTQHRETAHIANGTSNAFKKFSRQASIIISAFYYYPS